MVNLAIFPHMCMLASDAQNSRVNWPIESPPSLLNNGKRRKKTRELTD